MASNTDLEIAWLRAQSGITGDASLADLRRAVYGDDEHAHWAALSGLPAGSLSDHKRAAMMAATGGTGSLADVSRLYFAL